MTDEFIQNLIKRLEDDQLIDDTIIVLFTDHYAYGYSNVYEVKNISDVNLVQNVPFIIWYNNIDSKVIDTLVDSTDITPTVASLFGLNFDEKYYVGTNVFGDKHDNFVYFQIIVGMMETFIIMVNILVIMMIQNILKKFL